jgi:hypothetical protein
VLVVGLAWWAFAEELGIYVPAGATRESLNCPSGFGDNLDRQGFVPKRKGKYPRATGNASAATSISIFSRFEEYGSAFVSADAPCSAATAHECPDRELATRGSILDVAVREAQQQDRRCRDTYTLLRLSKEALLGFRGSIRST